MKSGTIITIGRQCGSGGHEIGKKLAARLGVPFYDRELLRLAAEQSGISHEAFETYDEVPTSSLLYSLSLGNYGMTMGQYDMPLHQQIFLAQFDTIQKLADKGESCVIIGRCADYALAEREQVLNIFIHADAQKRAKRMAEQYDLTARQAADQIVKTDKRRANYHNFYATTRWGSSDSYHLSVDSLSIGIDKTVELLADYANLVFPDVK